MKKVQASSYFYVPEPARAPAVPAHQQRIDAIVAKARGEQRPALVRPAPPLPQPLDPSADILETRVGEELLYVQRILEGMSDELSESAYILQRHGQALQGFDLASQILGHLARIVSSSDKEEAVERIGMQELRARLQRKPLFQSVQPS